MGARQPTVAKSATVLQTIDLNRVDAFVRVMEAGSFSAAARALGQPKSTLSRAVSKLERELGVVLLQRTTRKLAITEAGQLYLERAQGALGMLAEARAQLVEADVLPRGVVRFTAPPSDLEGMLAAALADFVRLYPGIHVDCVFTPRRVDLLAEGVDLAMRAGTVDDASLAGKKLGDTPLALYAAPSYLAARGTPRRAAQLADHDCILFNGARGRARWRLVGKRGPESVEVRGPINVDDLAYACQLALRGVGIALIPMMVGAPAVMRGELARVLPSLQSPGTAAYLVHPASAHLPRRVALLRDHLYAALKPSFTACNEHLRRSER
ncbi:MAG TPA: LysR family transcriptional regulator [Polyangiales bacterium]